jgi:hypothetical protein
MAGQPVGQITRGYACHSENNPHVPANYLTQILSGTASRLGQVIVPV